MQRIIFLDTNVFESAKFYYQSNNFIKFLDICEEREINLYITDVVKYEVIKRIETNIKDSIENIDKNNFSILIKSLRTDDIGKMKLIDELSKKLVLEFEELIFDYNIEVIPSNFNQEKLLDLYFKIQAPFSEQKKYEFPDAIIILTIQKWSEEHSKIPLIVSNDNDMASFCSIHKIKLYKKISDVTNLLYTENPDDELLKLYNVLLSKIKEKIIDEVKSREDNFILYSYDSIDEIYVEDIEIINTNIHDIDIINLNSSDNIIELEVNININFSLNASYPDMDTMGHDKEDGINIFWLRNHAELNTEERTTCYIQIILDKDEQDFNFDNFEISNNEFEFWLDENSIVKIEQSESYTTSKW